MGKLISFTNLSLDGVMQAPGRADEDTRDGFQHGGWATPFGAMQQAGDALANMGSLLFGRRTYEDFHSVWPKRSNNPFTGFLNEVRKYVASTTLHEPLPWQNSTLLQGTLAHAVAALKQQEEKDIVIFGSGVLIQSLMQSGLIDEYILLIHPLVLGSGRKLFADGGVSAALQLRKSLTTSSGVVVLHYQPAKSPDTD